MSLPYYRWFPTDFAGDARVRLMTATARGAYRELLDYSWEIGPVPDPMAVLETLGWPPEMWMIIDLCWKETPAGWVQPRLEKERKIARKRHSDAKKAVQAREAKKKRGSSPDHPRGDRSTDDPSKSRTRTRSTTEKKKAPPAPGRRCRNRIMDYPLLNIPMVVEALDAFDVYRKERKDKPWADSTWKTNLKKWSEWGPATLVEAIENTISANWRGIFHPQEKSHGKRTATPRRPDGSLYTEPEEPVRKFKFV